MKKFLYWTCIVVASIMITELALNTYQEGIFEGTTIQFVVLLVALTGALKLRVAKK